jgi:hypothetical protein
MMGVPANNAVKCVPLSSNMTDKVVIAQAGCWRDGGRGTQCNSRRCENVANLVQVFRQEKQ